MIEKIKKNKALVTLVVLISLFLIAGVSLGVYFQNLSKPPIVSPTRIPINPSMIVEVSPTQMVELPSNVTPTPDPLEDWRQYILSDCHVQLYIPKTWRSSARGTLDSCGVFWSEEPQDNAQLLSDYNGIIFLVREWGEESFMDFEYGNLKELLTSIERDLEELDDKDDFLYETETIVLGDKTATYAKIGRPDFGIMEYIFYEAYGDNFYIMYGGAGVLKEPETIQMILDSVEFLQPSKSNSGF